MICEKCNKRCLPLDVVAGQFILDYCPRCKQVFYDG